MPTKEVEVDGKRFSLKYGWGLINRIRAMQMDGMDRERMAKLVQSKAIKSQMKPGTKGEISEDLRIELTPDDILQAGLDFIKMSQDDLQRRAEILGLVLWEEDKKVSREYIETELSVDAGNVLWLELQTILREAQLTESQKKS